VGNLSVKLWEKLSRYNWIPFKVAREKVRLLKLNSTEDWLHFWKREKPIGIPRNPNKVYKEEWLGMGDWLGTFTIQTGQRKYLTYSNAKKYLKPLKINSVNEYRSYIRRNHIDFLPAAPNIVYKEFISFNDWLGKKEKVFKTFNEARKYSRSLKLTKFNDWRLHTKKKEFPIDIPTAPWTTYKNEWIDTSDWLGYKIETKNIAYLPFKKARKIARSFKLKSYSEWRNFIKNPLNKINGLPTNPNIVYKNKGWINIYDWIGVEERVPILPFKKARDYVIKKKFNSKSEYLNYIKKNNIQYLTVVPKRTYKNDGWINTNDYLFGLPNLGKWMSFSEAKAEIQKMDIQSGSEFLKKYNKRVFPFSNIPKQPSRYYENWKGWSDFLGKED